MTGNILLLLSPLDSATIEPHTAMQAAIGLKHHRVARADVAAGPRYSYLSAQNCHRSRAVPDFTAAARTLVQYILRPVLGQSEVCDLGHIPASPVLPVLPTLSEVGRLFAGGAVYQGRNLGLVFYLALHARTSDYKQYDLLVFPEIADAARQSLDRLGPVIVPGPVADIYGPAIDLHALRQGMAKLAVTRPASRLN